MKHPWIASYDPNIAFDTPLNPRPVGAMMDEARQQFGTRPAFNFLGKKWTWQAIATMVDSAASALQAKGVGKGDQVGLFLPNCPLFLIAYYAIMKTGATAVHFNPLYARHELINQINDSETKIMISLNLTTLTDNLLPLLDDTVLETVLLSTFTRWLPFPKNALFKLTKGRDITPDQNDPRIVNWEDMLKGHTTPTAVTINPHEDVALLQYTGGTTGIPKGAMLTHANITANTEQSFAWFPQTVPGQEKMVGVLPFFHVFAMTAVMNMSVRAGMEIIALPRFDLNQTLKLIDKHKPTYFPAVPAIYTAINNHPKRDDYDLSSIKYCISGGAPLPVEVKKDFEQTTGCTLVEGYGLTESSPVVCVNPTNGSDKQGCIGLPVPQTIVSIRSTEKSDTIMPVGERGELCVEGPQVMKGYWKRPEDTESVLKNGVLHTGDVAIMEEDGMIRIVDRIKDLILTNGYNVYPRHIEEAVYTHPAIEECVAGGLPDKQRGERVKLWLTLKTGCELSESELRTYLKERISPIEMPRDIEFRDEPLPKTMIGKLSRKDLIEQEKE